MKFPAKVFVTVERDGSADEGYMVVHSSVSDIEDAQEVAIYELTEVAVMKVTCSLVRADIAKRPKR